MKDVVIFVGPTLPVNEARQLLFADYLGPVAQGDVLRAARHRPWAIGIIDGYFDQLPAVWHKEILWAMSQGVRVFGAASIGALRAAELASFGMVGTGTIYEAFRTGEFCADDEVTIVHGPADTGYLPLSVAMVDIRATLAAAQSAAVLKPRTAEALIGLAKRLPYFERSYQRLAQEARQADIDAGALQRLASWIPEHAVHRKRLDAELMLREIALERRAEHAPKPANFTFEHTDAFEQMWQRARTLDDELPSNAPQCVDGDLLDELRLEPASYEVQRESALARLLALEFGEARGLGEDDADYRATAEAFRRDRGLLDTQTTLDWLERRDLSREQFATRMRENARIRRVRAMLHDEVEKTLLDLLQLTEDYERIAARARAKRSWLELCGGDVPSLQELGLSEEEILDWYFGRLGRRRPDAAGVLRWIEWLEYRDPYAFLRAVVREYLFVRERIDAA